MKDYTVSIRVTYRAIALISAENAAEALTAANTGNWDELVGEDLCDWEVVGPVKEYK